MIKSAVKASLKADMEISKGMSRVDEMWSMRGRLESTADSTHGTIAMEEDIESNAVKEEMIKDDTSYTALNNSGGPDDLT